MEELDDKVRGSVVGDLVWGNVGALLRNSFCVNLPNVVLLHHFSCILTVPYIFKIICAILPCQFTLPSVSLLHSINPIQYVAQKITCCRKQYFTASGMIAHKRCYIIHLHKPRSVFRVFSSYMFWISID